MSLKSFYEGLYEYEKSTDIETIEALARCVLRNLTREELRDTVKGETYAQALDVGCGIGFSSLVLFSYANVNNLIGVDIASGAVKIAKKRMTRRGIKSRTDFMVCDAQALPFRERIFDIVVCTEVLEHLSDDVRGVSAISKVTKEGGKVFISVPSARDTFAKYCTKEPAKTMVKSPRAMDKRYFGLQTGGDLRNYQIEDLKELLYANKLKIVRHWFNGRFFCSLSIRLNLLISGLGQRLLKIGGRGGDFIRGSASNNQEVQKTRRLLMLYSKIVIPLSNAIMSLDLIFLRFNYGGNLTIEAQLYT